MLKKIPVKKYKYTNSWDGTIHKVEIERESEKSVFFSKVGKYASARAAKETSDTVYRDTPEEAFEWVKEKKERELFAIKKRYNYYKEKYDNFIERGMVCKSN